MKKEQKYFKVKWVIHENFDPNEPFLIESEVLFDLPVDNV